MSNFVIGILGLATIVAIVVTLFRSKTQPAVAFIVFPATLLGTGLAEVDIKDHIKASFLYVWAFSILCMLFAAAVGILPL